MPNCQGEHDPVGRKAICHLPSDMHQGRRALPPLVALCPLLCRRRDGATWRVAQVKLSHFRCRCQLLCTGCDRKWGGDRAANSEDSEDEREQDERQESRSKRHELLERRGNR